MRNIIGISVIKPRSQRIIVVLVKIRYNLPRNLLLRSRKTGFLTYPAHRRFAACRHIQIPHVRLFPRRYRSLPIVGIIAISVRATLLFYIAIIRIIRPVLKRILRPGLLHLHDPHALPRCAALLKLALSAVQGHLHVAVFRRLHRRFRPRSPDVIQSRKCFQIYGGKAVRRIPDDQRRLIVRHDGGTFAQLPPADPRTRGILRKQGTHTIPGKVLHPPCGCFLCLALRYHAGIVLLGYEKRQSPHKQCDRRCRCRQNISRLL